MKIRHGIANLENLEINIQFDINSKCSLIKLPNFNRSVVERESLGGGWYGDAKETITFVEKNAYAVLNKNIPIAFIVAEKNGKVYLQGKNSCKFFKNYCKKYSLTP